MTDYVKDEAFCFTYGDGVANIDITAQVAITSNMASALCGVAPGPLVGSIWTESCPGFIETTGRWRLINGGFCIVAEFESGC